MEKFELRKGSRKRFHFAFQCFIESRLTLAVQDDLIFSCPDNLQSVKLKCVLFSF